MLGSNQIYWESDKTTGKSTEIELINLWFFRIISNYDY